MINKIMFGLVLVILIGASIFYYTNGFKNSVFITKQKIIVGTDATYPPLEYVNDKGDIVGFDIDVVKALAKEMNADIEIKNISFDKLFESLADKEIDVVASSVTITDDRQKEMLFSSPYLNVGQVVVTRKDSDILGADDLRGLKVGVQANTTSEEEGLKYSDSLTTYINYDLALSDLLNNKIDAIIIDYPAGVSMTQSHNNEIKIVGNPFTSEFYGFAVSNNNQKMLDKINSALSTIKKNGLLDKLENDWFKR